MILKKIIFFTAVFSTTILLTSCNNISSTQNSEKTIQTSTEEILDTDISFSDMSRQSGMKKAFIEYISDEGVLLRPGHPPLVGADAIDFLSQIDDSGYTLTWKPMRGEIAKSGDLGYTYGIYELQTQDTVYKGTYVSIWKKQSDGSWKFVLDSGNEGIQNFASY